MSCIGAMNETRTRDPDLGKVVLYQLSYHRILLSKSMEDHHFLSKAGAKVLLFYDMCKFFGEKMQKKYHFLIFPPFSILISQFSI